MKDTRFHFKNMDPSGDVRAYAEKVASQILETAPYDSRAIALVERRDDGYCASMDIYSQTGPFIGQGFGLEPAGALDSLRDDLRIKLSPRKSVLTASSP